MIGAMTLVATVAIACAVVDPQNQPKPQSQLVINWLVKNFPGYQGQPMQPIEIDDPNLGDLTRGLMFFSLHFREFPMQVVPPKPLASRNILTVDSRNNVTLFAVRENLRKAFPGMTRDVAKGSMRLMGLSWLRASTEYDQDGFFQFLWNEKNLKLVETDGGCVVTAVAPVVEKGGDTGSLTATLTFVPTQTLGRYRLQSIKEVDTIKPGVRPVCQCTLLLDQNPVVRRMAERDLLVMGKWAFPYMRDQMAQATPELRKEIERVWKRIEAGDR